MLHPAQPHFRIMEHENTEPCIVLEPLDGDQEQTFKRAIRFGLKPGTSVNDANLIIGYLRDHLVSVSEFD